MADLVIGIDIGGTKIAAGLLDLQGNILVRGSSRSQNGCAPGQVVEAVIQTVRSLMASAGITARQVAGVGVAGYSVFFVTLDKATQDDIIRRTEHEL